MVSDRSRVVQQDSGDRVPHGAADRGNIGRGVETHAQDVGRTGRLGVQKTKEKETKETPVAAALRLSTGVVGQGRGFGSTEQNEEGCIRRAGACNGLPLTGFGPSDTIPLN